MRQTITPTRGVACIRVKSGLYIPKSDVREGDHLVRAKVSYVGGILSFNRLLESMDRF